MAAMNDTHRAASMQAKGWDFMPTGPNEWDWLKFDAEGNVIAKGGDETWNADIKSVESK